MQDHPGRLRRPHPKNLDDLIRSARDAVRDHNTTALLIDDVTRLRLHCGDDQDTLDLIRELMDLNVTLVLWPAAAADRGRLHGSDHQRRGTITPELLARTSIRLGNLDDLDPEAGEVPEIPDGVPPPRQKKSRRPRNTVFDDRGGKPAADG